MTAFDELVDGMTQGRAWSLMGDGDAVRVLLDRVYDERCHSARHHRDAYQLRVNLQKKNDAASYAGWITAENPTSGPYQGTTGKGMPRLWMRSGVFEGAHVQLCVREPSNILAVWSVRKDGRYGKDE